MKIYYHLLILPILFLGGFTQSFAQSIGISIPDSTVVEGESVTMPLVVDSSLTGYDVLSYQLQIRYNDSYVRLDSITTGGALSENWQVTVNNEVDGEVTVAAAGGSALSGTGILFNMHFTTRRYGNSSISFTGEAYNYLNEGEPALITNNGYIRIDQRPRLNISPSSDLLTRGEQQQFSVSGGTVPYRWSLTNPGIASIDTNGLLTAEAPGFTRVVAEDAAGIVDTSAGEVEVRGFMLSSQDTSEYQGLETVIPIYVSDLSGLNITSGRFDLRFNTNQFTLLEVTGEGSLLENGSEISWSSQSNGAAVAFATSEMLTSGGILMYARLYLSPDYSGSHSIYFEDILFNETLSGNQLRAGFRVDALPDLNLSPLTAQMLTGDSLQFQVSNNTGFVTWSVSDEQKASIDSSGWLYAAEGGTVTVTATDSISATRTSNVITIYDIEVSMPDTSGIVGDTLLIPVRLTNLPAVQAISSVEGELSFNEDIIELTEIVTAGSMSEGWSFTVRSSPDRLIFAGAGTGEVNADGTLFNVKGVINPDLTSRRTSGLNFQQLTLNEGTPSAHIVNGSLQAEVTVEAPALQFPASGSTEIGPDTAFEWSTVNGAAGYQLQLAEDNAFTTVVVDTVDIAATTVNLSGLTTGTTYYWRVRGISSSGTVGAWSSVFDFTTVAFVNTRPLLLGAMADLSVQEDFQPFSVASLDTVFEEPDVNEGDSLVYGVELSNSLAEGSIEEKQLSLTSVPDSNGVFQVIVTATDIYGASVADTFSVTIHPINDIPELALSDDTLRFQNDTTVTVNLWDYVSDVETAVDQLAFGFDRDTSAVVTSYDGVNGILSIEAPAFEGTAEIRITVTDEQLASAVDTLFLRVGGPNAAPVVASPFSDLTLHEDFSSLIAARMDTVFADPDVSTGDSLTYSIEVSTNIINAAFTGTLQLQLSPKPDSSGVTVLTVRATDAAGLFVEDDFTVTVTPVNDLPVWSLPDDTLKFRNDSTATVALWSYVSDVETESPNLSFEFNAGDAAVQSSYDGATGQLTIEAPGFVGHSQLIVTARDPDQGAAEDTLHLEVTTATNIRSDTDIPLAYELHSNYPNPFNPSTNIRYALPEAAHVKVAIFNMSGQKITTLVDKFQSAGSHGVIFEAGNLSSGIYFIQFQTPNFQKIRKMMLLK